MKNLLLTLSIILLICKPASSQETLTNKGIGVRKTFLDFNTFNDKDFDAFREYANGMEIFLTQNLKNRFTLVIPLGIATLTDSLNDNSINPTIMLGAQVQFTLLKNNTWFRPYLAGGVNAGIPKLREFFVNVPLGIGANFVLHPQVSLQWQSDYRLPVVNGTSYLQHSIGIAYTFGNFKMKHERVPEMNKLEEVLIDSDGDSIPDKLDLCPTIAGIQEFNGCPDTDKDGVSDTEDRCPETAGIKKLHGCPDSDEDGIADSDDECPNVKGTKSNKGCPDPKDLDNDEDGIANKNDLCPDEKGPKNTKGCPDRDADGIADKDDKCPDQVGVKSNNGCPEEIDTDKDGVPDNIDSCPNEKGSKKNNGCPDMVKAKMNNKEKEKTEEKPKEKMKEEPKEVKKEKMDEIANEKVKEEPKEKMKEKPKEKIEEKPKEKVLPKDSDNDGVTDDKDLCPDKAGLLETLGCPDSDGDGVADKDDKCPDVKGLKSNKGCPEVIVAKKDSDSDGISDDEDDCPFAAGLAKFKGCPDSDGDGVHDKIDKCPKTFASTPDGCPVIEKKDLEVLDYAMRAVQFDLSRSTLRQESFAMLDKVADIMFRNPDYNLIIGGHTDNTGPENKNIELSDRRAKVCMDYLVTRKVPPSRMSHVGFGSSKPIADNITETGRFLNRRTEFTLVAPK
ncbi:MAG: OmpA family protein [Saprospiraceae bacterium]|nr:OmpA family protein [Saprospiraceae bacterium]